MSIEYRTIHHINGKVERIVVGVRRDTITFKIEAWRMAKMGIADMDALQELILTHAAIKGVPVKFSKDGSVVEHGIIAAEPDMVGNLWVTWTP